MVARRVVGRSKNAVLTDVLDLRGKPLRPPQEEELQPSSTWTGTDSRCSEVSPGTGRDAKIAA